MLTVQTTSQCEMPDSKQRVHARIIKAIKAVPVGCTASYGGIARAAGLPGRARLVGWILRNADAEMPWHRIVCADGRSAFAVESAEWREQRERLAAEGLRMGYLGSYPLAAEAASDMDAELWRPAILGGPEHGPAGLVAHMRAKKAAQIEAARLKAARKCHH